MGGRGVRMGGRGAGVVGEMGAEIPIANLFFFFAHSFALYSCLTDSFLSEPSLETAAFNANYGGATPNITYVIALQGSDDPWQGAGVERALRETYPEFTAG